MWRLEKDPYLSSNVGTITILDRAPGLRSPAGAHGAGDRRDVPRLRWRVQPNPADLGAPIWADDPDFDIDYHVRRISLPQPGTRRQLYDLAALIDARPARPDASAVAVHDHRGLEGGQAALFTKMHHTITDGINGVRMSTASTSISTATARSRCPRSPSAPPRESAPPPSSVEVCRPWPRVRGVRRGQLPSAARDRQARCVGCSPIRSHPEGRAPPRSRHRSRAALAAVGHGRGTVSAVDTALDAPPVRDRANEVRAHEDSRQAPRRAASTPPSSRQLPKRRRATTSSTAPRRRRFERRWRSAREQRTRAPTPSRSCGCSCRPDEMPIAERFALVADIADAARTAPGSGAMEAVATVATALPTSLMTRLARQQTQSIDFATSNVRASPVPVYIAGARCSRTTRSARWPAWRST